MSKRDETPVIRFRRGYDINVLVPTTRLEGFVRVNNRDQKVVLETDTDDGVLQGPVEGWLLLKPGFDQDCERLELTNANYFRAIRQVLKGRAKMAYMRVLAKPFWADANNRVDANRDRFWQDM